MHTTWDKHVNIYIVEIEFTDKVLGGQPKSEAIMRAWLLSKLRREAAEAQRRGEPFLSAEQQQELIDKQVANIKGRTVDGIVDSEEEQKVTGCFADEHGRTRSGTVRAETRVFICSGGRGVGPIKRCPLGSVGRSCADHTTVPLVIVPDDYETIQAAIDAAEDGDSVLVAAGGGGGDNGEYIENSNFERQGPACGFGGPHGCQLYDLPGSRLHHPGASTQPPARLTRACTSGTT